MNLSCKLSPFYGNKFECFSFPFCCLWGFSGSREWPEEEVERNGPGGWNIITYWRMVKPELPQDSMGLHTAGICCLPDRYESVVTSAKPCLATARAQHNLNSDEKNVLKNNSGSRAGAMEVIRLKRISQNLVARWVLTPLVHAHLQLGISRTYGPWEGRWSAMSRWRLDHGSLWCLWCQKRVGTAERLSLAVSATETESETHLRGAESGVPSAAGEICNKESE